jgi:hypothetical protein
MSIIHRRTAPNKRYQPPAGLGLPFGVGFQILRIGHRILLVWDINRQQGVPNATISTKTAAHSLRKAKLKALSRRDKGY